MSIPVAQVPDLTERKYAYWDPDPQSPGGESINEAYGLAAQGG